jgi:hypothetical protein
MDARIARPPPQARAEVLVDKLAEADGSSGADLTRALGALVLTLMQLEQERRAPGPDTLRWLLRPVAN